MNIHPKIIELLNKRGIESQAEISEFLSDKPQQSYDPFLLYNMEAGVDLILSAIENGEKICIYGDYDADGITSTAILLEVIGNLTKKIGYYIPTRFDEGYGLNEKALDKIRDLGYNLVITVDCGSVSYDEVEHGKSIGLKILVTDHHTITDKKADCLIINPKQSECTYPYKFLAGCGVAFKLAQALVIATGLSKSVLNRTLDYLGIGTIGDIVPLLDENRTFAKYGLRAINTGNRDSISGLIDEAHLNKGAIGSEDVAFVIVPHLNAAGRMLNASKALEMLRATDADEIRNGVELLVQCNKERKEKQEETFQLCIEIVEEKYFESNFILIELEDAHEGITGIVAGKIKDKYTRPAIILTPTEDGCYKGTGRSIEGVNIYDLLKVNEELLVRFGGHSAACGFTVKKNNIEILRNNLENQMKNIFEENPDIFESRVEPDIRLEAKDINFELVEQLSLIEPCGACNPKPLVEIKGSAMNIKRMGSDNQFLKFRADLGGNTLTCLAFRGADEFEEILQKNKKVSIIGTLGSNSWNGRRYLQLMIETVEAYNSYD